MPDNLDGMKVSNADKAQQGIDCVRSNDPALRSCRDDVVVVQEGLLLWQMKNFRKINMRETYQGEHA